MLKGLSAGITSYGKAFRIISHLGLWGYLFIPALLSLFIASIIGSTAWNLSDDIGHFLVNWYPWEFGLSIIEKVSTVFSGVLIIGLGLVLYKHLVIIISAPFMSPLSEKVENYLEGRSTNCLLYTSPSPRD